MIAGANAADNLLLVIETQRKGQGVIDSVRKELSGLGYDAKAIGPAMAAGAEAGIAEIQKLSRTINTASKADVAAFRASTAALREMAQAAGLAPAQIQKLAVAEEMLAARTRAATQEARAQAAQLLATSNRLDVVSPKARTAANAFTAVSFAATGMGGSLQGGIIASGTMVASLASLSSSAAIAASASGIGAVIVVLATLIPLLDRATSATFDTTEALKQIGQMREIAEVSSFLRGISDSINHTREALRSVKAEVGGLPSVAGVPLVVPPRLVEAERQLKSQLESQIKLRAEAEAQWYNMTRELADAARKKAESDAEAASRRAADRRRRDAEAALADQRRLAGAVLDLVSARDNDIYTQRRLKIERAYAEEVYALTKLEISDSRRLGIQQQAYQVRNLSLEALKEEVRLLNQAYARETRMMSVAGGGNVAEKYRAREAEIEAERAADLKRLGDSPEARVEVERRAQLKIRQLQRDTVRGTVGDLKILEDATINSKNRTVRAIGLAAQTLRRLEIGAEAARASVESARAFAKVPGYLAAQQYGSAALSAASGVQLAAAAALGFREAMGGGGGGAGGSAGSGSGGADRGTFEPRTTSQGAGSVVINLITRNPYGRDSIQQVAWELNRSGILNRPPIEIPPTLGIQPTGIARSA